MEVGEPPAIMEDPPQPKEARKETQMPVGEPPSIMEDPKLQKEARKDKQIPLTEPYLTMEEPPQPKKIPEAPVVFVKQEVNVEPMKEHIVIDPLAINPETGTTRSLGTKPKRSLLILFLLSELFFNVYRKIKVSTFLLLEK